MASYGIQFGECHLERAEKSMNGVVLLLMPPRCHKNLCGNWIVKIKRKKFAPQ